MPLRLMDARSLVMATRASNAARVLPHSSGTVPAFISLISESIRRFEEQDAREKVAEARTDLAICYWREGAMDEARIWFQSALETSKDPANQLRAFHAPAGNAHQT